MMWSQGFTDGHRGQLLVTSVARAIINKVKGKLGNRLGASLSQLECMYTTVPINVNPPNLSGRHTPTRRSMERSRIIHLKVGDPGRRRPRMRYYRFLMMLVAVQIIVGVTLASVAIYTSTVTPSLRIRDLPHWAGIPLTVSGLVGLVFVTRCYGDYKDDTVANISKIVSGSLVMVSMILCACAVAFNSLHMVTFTRFDECNDGPYPALPGAHPGIFGGLYPDAAQESSTSESSSSEGTPISCTCSIKVSGDLKRLYVYELIACSDVLALIKFLFIVMSILSCVAIVDGALYVLMLWIFRYKDIYVGPRDSTIKEPSPSRSST